MLQIRPRISFNQVLGRSPGLSLTLKPLVKVSLEVATPPPPYLAGSYLGIVPDITELANYNIGLPEARGV